MQTTQKPCASANFNYCKWARIIVAIPALPLLAWMAAILFANPILQLAAAIGAVILAVLGAIWIDRLPSLQKKFRSCPHCETTTG